MRKEQLGVFREAGREQEIHSERDRKLAAARQQRQVCRQQRV